MKSGRRIWLLCAVLGMTASGHAFARETQAFDTAIRNRDFTAAAREVERLAGPEGAKRRGGPLLDAYYGRYFAALAQGQIAEPYLVRAIANARDPADRDALALELARSREVEGFAAKAEADYRKLAASATDPGVRNASVLALARRTLGDAPDEAVTLLTPLLADANPASIRWEAQLLLSRAHAIQGNATEASSALAAAWKLAPLSDRPGYAIAVTAMDLSLDRLAANDREAGIGLTSLGLAGSSFKGAAQLPVCDAVVRPEDSVIIAISADRLQRPVYSVVRASRPGIAGRFMVPLALAPQTVEGTTFAVSLRCRGALAQDLRFAGATLPTLIEWLGQRAYHPPLLTLDATDDDVSSQFKTRVQQLQSRMAPEAPELAPIMLQLAWMEAQQSSVADPVKFAEARALAQRAVATLTKAGAPQELILASKAQNALVFEPAQTVADTTGPLAVELFETLASRPDATPEKALGAVYWVNTNLQLRPAQRLAMIDRLVTFLEDRRVPTTDPMRQAVELGRAEIIREIGSTAGLSDRLARSGIGSDLCSAAERPASFPPPALTFNSNDYPKDLLMGRVNGYDLVEMSLDAQGKVIGHRVIASQPPGLFDDITIEKLKAARMMPAQQEGRPVPCRAFVVPIRWQLPS